MPQVQVGGYRSPFNPFERPDGSLICEPTGDGLSLWCSKLAPKRADQWLAAASWTNGAGNQVGAMSWRSGQGGEPVRGEVVWGDRPLTYDPRPAGQKEAWGQHRPRYGGNGFWTGAVFADAQDVTISNPADVSATTYQLAPGVTIVPQINAPFYGGYIGQFPDGERYLFGPGGNAASQSPQFNRTTMPGSPIRGYSAQSALAFGFRVSGQIYRFNNATTYFSGNFSSTPSVNNPANYASQLGTEFGYSVFYEGMTPAQIPDAHQSAAPLPRPVQEGDMIGTFLGVTIAYQPADSYTYYTVDTSSWDFEFWEPPPSATITIPAGTLVTYTWAQTGLEKVAPITSRANAIDGFGVPYTSRGWADDGINDRYGVSVRGSTGAANINRSGKCYILEWWRDQHVLHEGTYSIRQKVREEQEEDRPPGASGPASGGNPWPGWPSKRDKCNRFVAGLSTYTTTRPWEGTYDELTTPVTLDWTYFGQVLGSATINYKTATWRETPTRQESGVYNPAEGGPPQYSQVVSQKTISYHANYPTQSDLFASGGGVLKVTMVGTVERNAFGQRIGGCWQESPPTIDPSLGANVTLGANSSNTMSNGQPIACAVYGQYSHGGLVTQSVQVRTAVLRPGSAPPIAPPNCPLEDGRPGSAAPGFPTDPEVPGLPPGGHGNRAGAKRVSEVEVEYEIQAPIARGLTSRSYYYEKTGQSKGGSVQWNGTDGNSPYSPEASISTTLEFREPVTLIRDDLAGFEEVVFVVLEFDRKTGTFSAQPPPPADHATVYYQKVGSEPIALPESFKSGFPAAAWADPRSWNWTQWICLKGGKLYLLDRSSEVIESYRQRRTKLPAQVYRVDDGSFAPLDGDRFSAKSLQIPGGRVATMLDHNINPQGSR